MDMLPFSSGYRDMAWSKTHSPTSLVPLKLLPYDNKNEFQLVVDMPEGTTLEETARVSGLPPGGRWWNQAFLTSWQGAYSVKNVLGVVPVHEDGSAYFEVPPGRAVYFEALDEQGRWIEDGELSILAPTGRT